MAVNISHMEVAGEQCLLIAYALKRPLSFSVLTAAELEVTEGVIAGLSARSLSRRRGVSERTVSNQLARIYRKLGVCSRYELIALVSGARGEVGG